ncbi:thioredoxin family protein [Pseudonocardia pini]|uniref:thioredoxin family protein n=1 Tax=Pseudonocardia pini TaxID=2758030 RepID=UPI001C68C161|nr:thioredoxin domain-containing protein [Pseudonocardia pini]
MIEQVTDGTFTQRVLRAPLPVLVEFTASWCPPCRMIAPVLAELAGDLAGRVEIVALDVDDNPRTAAAAGVLGMPTMSLYVGGEVVAQVVGARPKAALRSAIEPHLPVDNSVGAA